MKGTWNFFLFHNFFHFYKVLIQIEMIYGFKIFESLSQ